MKTVKWNKTRYSSISKCAKSNKGFTVYKLEAGQTGDRVVFNNVGFAGIVECSRHFGIPRQTLSGRIKRGWTGTNYTFDGMGFFKIADVVAYMVEGLRKQGIYKTPSQCTTYYYHKLGLRTMEGVLDHIQVSWSYMKFSSSDDIITHIHGELKTRGVIVDKRWVRSNYRKFTTIHQLRERLSVLAKRREFEWGGKVFENRTLASKNMRLSAATLNYYKSKGYTNINDINTTRIKPITFDGVEYRSVSNASQQTGLSKYIIKKGGTYIKQSQRQLVNARRNIFK